MTCLIVYLFILIHIRGCAGWRIETNVTFRQKQIKRKLNEFFKRTYIQKETVVWHSNRWLPNGYNHLWNIFRFHHACFQHGKDGIYIGTDTVDEQYRQNWKMNEPDDRRRKHLLDEHDWNSIGERHYENDDMSHQRLMNSYRAKRVTNETIRELHNIRIVKGASFAFNFDYKHAGTDVGLGGTRR